MPKSEAYIKAQRKYELEKRKLRRKQYVACFSYATDDDIIQKLDSEENRTDYIRRLIRRDIEENKKSE